MFDWKNTEAIIPAVVSIAKRADSLQQLLVDLSIQCPGISATVIPQWKTAIKINHRRAFESIAKGLHKMSSPWIFYMEEDIKLSTKFGELVPDILNNMGDDWGAVSLFSFNSDDVRMLRSGMHYYEISLTYSQCLVMKLEVAKAWEKSILPWWDNAPKTKKEAIDASFRECCENLGLKVFVRLPNLVQHRCLESGFGLSHRPKSYVFIDDLD